MTYEQISAVKKAAREVSNPKFGTHGTFSSESDRHEWLRALDDLKKALQHEPEINPGRRTAAA